MIYTTDDDAGDTATSTSVFLYIPYPSLLYADVYFERQSSQLNVYKASQLERPMELLLTLSSSNTTNFNIVSSFCAPAGDYQLLYVRYPAVAEINVRNITKSNEPCNYSAANLNPGIGMFNP